MTDRIFKVFDKILNIVGKDNVFSADLSSNIDEDYYNSNYDYNMDINIYTKNNPYELSYKTYKSIEDTINYLDCNVSVCLTEDKYAFHNMNFEEIDFDYYDGVDPDHCYVIENAGNYKSNKSFINIKMNFNNNEYTKNVIDLYVSRELNLKGNKINRLLDDLKEDGYIVDKKFYVKENKYNIDDILLDISNILTNKDILDELNLLNGKDTIINDKEILLNFCKKEISLTFLYEGYDFCWNFPNLTKFEKYNIPINYMLVEKGWSDEINTAKRETVHFNKIYDPLILVNHFKNSVNLNKQDIESSNKMKIIINKGKSEHIIESLNKIYLTNKNNEVIFSIDNNYVLDKNLLKKDINYIIDKINVVTN